MHISVVITHSAVPIYINVYTHDFVACFCQVGLRHKINDNLMIYPGYVPREDVEPILMHYGLPFSVGNWSFSKLDHHEDNIVYDCGRLFPEPPYPREVNSWFANWSGWICCELSLMLVFSLPTCWKSKFSLSWLDKRQGLFIQLTWVKKLKAH